MKGPVINYEITKMHWQNLKIIFSRTPVLSLSSLRETVHEYRMSSLWYSYKYNTRFANVALVVTQYSYSFLYQIGRTQHENAGSPIVIKLSVYLSVCPCVCLSVRLSFPSDFVRKHFRCDTITLFLSLSIQTLYQIYFTKRKRSL